ncbi:hypothetical protein BS78_09G167000 [Paspalum vaginatum]|nr:hypothetical protein BS78_09G167000 [Paspalum vaginatum]
MERRAEDEKRGRWKGADDGAALPAHGDGDGDGDGDGKGGASAASFGRRCVGFVKEQRARLYVARRCVTMLACWRDKP